MISPNGKPLRVIQWATGGVGKAAVEAVVNHPELELVGCWVHSAVKSGRDVGEILGREPLGVVASSNKDDVLAIDADCVVYSPLIPDDEEVKAILRSGKNIVTPVGWVYPDPTDPGVQAIEKACANGGVSLHGSGIHPGGITEKFPLMISALSTAITHVRAEEFSDIRTYNAPDVVHHIMGFGKSPEEAALAANTSPANASSTRDADAQTKDQPKAVKELTPEEQMALFEQELKENDWGHQPC